MEYNRKKQIEKVFNNSKKLILSNKWGFLWRTIIFLLLIFTITILLNYNHNFKFLGYSIFSFKIFLPKNYILFYCINTLNALIILFLITMLIKLYLISEKENKPSKLKNSKITLKVYVKVLIFNILYWTVVSIPIIVAKGYIMTELFSGTSFDDTPQRIRTVIFILACCVLYFFILRVLFFSTMYILLDNENIGIFSAIKRSILILEENYISTIKVLFFLDIQFMIALLFIAFIKMFSDKIPYIIDIISIIIISYMVTYLYMVKIKWYKYLDGLMEIKDKKKSKDKEKVKEKNKIEDKNEKSFDEEPKMYIS